MNERLQHFCITFRNPPCVSEQSRVNRDAELSACNHHIRAETTFKALKVDPGSLYETLLKLTADICKGKHLKPLFILKNTKKHKWGIAATQMERARQQLWQPLAALLLCLFTFSLVWTSMHGCSHHIYTCHTPQTLLRAQTFLSSQALVVRLSQYSPSSQILTHFLCVNPAHSLTDWIE